METPSAVITGEGDASRKNEPGRMCVQQQKQPSSSEAWTGCASACATEFRASPVPACDPGNVPAVQMPAEERSRTISKNSKDAANLTFLSRTRPV